MIVRSVNASDGYLYVSCHGRPLTTIKTEESYLLRKVVRRVDKVEHTEDCDEEGQDVIFGTPNRRLERIASIVGMSIGCDYNDTSTVKGMSGRYCMMGYDVECEFDPQGSIPDRGRIICASVSCSCGYSMSYGTVRCNYPRYYKRVSNSTRVASELMRCIQSHMPLFIVGHNVYQFDNRVLAYWIGCDHEYADEIDIDRYFRSMPSTRTSDDGVSVMMTIPGTNNLDTLVWFRSTMFTDYRSFGLDALCKAEGIEGKSSKSRFSTCLTPDEMLRMIRYNVRDCEMVVELCKKKSVTDNVLYLSRVTGAPLADVAVYHTGAMGSCALSKEAMRNGTAIVWRKCGREVVEMKGGHVHFRSPILAKGVVSLDFNSMYPNIMVSARISPECMEIFNCSSSDDDRRRGRGEWLGFEVDWEVEEGNGCVESRFRVAYLCGGERVVEEVVYGGSDADGNPKPSYASAVCEKSMNDRKRAKASGDALMANSLKICANSLYGSTGNSRSVSYSPLCSMAVTGAGRWLLGVMMVSSRCFRDTVIVYGDTDSTFLSPGKETIAYARSAMKSRDPEARAGVEEVSGYITGVIGDVCTHILSYTPYDRLALSPVVMDRDSGSTQTRSMAVLKPKMYASTTRVGNVVAKGLSVVKRDRTEMQSMMQRSCLQRLMTARLRSGRHPSTGSGTLPSGAEHPLDGI